MPGYAMRTPAFGLSGGCGNLFRMTTATTDVRRRPAPLDAGIVVAGVVAFVFSFFGYYTASVSGSTRTTGAWHGFFGWFAAVVALLAALVLAVAFAVRRGSAPPYRTVLVLFAIATLSVFAALFTSGFDTTRVHGLGVAADTGHGFGYWISLGVIIAGTLMSLARVQQVGGRLPGVLGRSPSLRGTKREG
jgi:hypothetical protein